MTSELAFHHALALSVLGTGAGVFVWLCFVTAPYGRHTRGGWGPQISSRVGWVVMESPSAVGFLAVFAVGAHALTPVPLLLAALWLGHYVHRAFVYPLRFKSGEKPMPASVAAMAVVFNVINAYLNARWISSLGDYPTELLGSPRLLAGMLCFLGGMALNLHSDAVLRGLRKPGEHGYQIPRGGGFRWVSAPNYLGELIEWSGWALATWSLAGLAFALFSAANLVPRALSNHRWYRQTFPDYPGERKALVPFVL
jgi:protein-S-isoprenylcysteine O-methyltransferase Ste14